MSDLKRFLLSVKETADLLGITKRYLYKLVADKVILPVQCGGRKKFRPCDVARLAEKGWKKPVFNKRRSK